MFAARLKGAVDGLKRLRTDRSPTPPSPTRGEGDGERAPGAISSLKRRLQDLLRKAPLDADGIARIAARQIYIMPTPTGVLYAVAAFAMLMGSLNYQNNLGLLFTFFLVAVGLVAMHHCWFNLLGLAVQVRPGPAVFAGTPAQFEVTLHNTRAGPRFDLRLAGGVDPGTPVCVNARDQQTVLLGVPTRRRGLLQLPAVELETRHPMHLFRAWCYAQTHAESLVYPRPAAAAPPPVQDQGQARRPAQRGGEGRDDYLGPREYRYGDSPHHLDWKALARERGLIVKQFGGEEGLDVWIDWARSGGGDPETRIGLLTRQLLDTARAQVRFGLRLPGRELTLDRGEAHLQRCLAALALFNPGGDRGQA
ncbi:DUF58 domain-containing protein [uncultured Thiodictyon sp.]|uniref:DUF58 domain-containing protein n=1 Tax=uncultured Thiodictyon sp. TaxID=1846217 RepID=UPI0026015CEB|nr:DUF58 domain-containing protein [uncultured Thiodictyon sp.]